MSATPTALDDLIVDAERPGFFPKAFLDDPYPAYARFRDEAPVFRDPRGPWMVFRYDDVRRVFRDYGSFSSRLVFAPDAPRTQRLVRAWGDGVLNSPHLSRADPPEHTALRRVLARSFTPVALEEFRPRLRRIVEDAVTAAVHADEELDVIAALARPIPYRVICELLGYPITGDETLMSRCTTAFQTVTQEPFLDDDQVEAVVEANAVLSEHIRDAVTWKREHLRDDVMSMLLAAGEGGGMTDEQVVDQVRLLFAAGHETTVNGIGNGVLAMLGHRSEWQRLIAEPSLLSNAVEELLRYDNTVQLNWRSTVADCELNDTPVPAGSSVLAWVGSANRDPRRFGASADDLDISRPDADQHVAFGFGAHHCLGAYLVRLEMQELLAVLARDLPDLELAEEAPAWEPRIGVRGLQRLVIRSSTAGRA